ncbi:hypothetical protein BDW59DRAFT_87309 [Aspergillus cavernicola]|uniref:Uncharacterized protein n=1 Tax=Aspergillus cavernicola TaxID=176166 RepID=A0ABR4I911_9EURO
MASLIQSFLDPFSSRLIWIIGNISVVRGIRCWISPASQYEEYGLPLEQSTEPTAQSGATSPLIYVKGIRDFGYGVMLMTLHNMGDERAVTVLVANGALMTLADAFVVWRFGGAHTRTAWQHLLIGVLFAVWYWLRLPSQQGYQVTVKPR